MSYEFTRLSEVEELTEVSQNTTALAVVDGAVKRIPISDPSFFAAAREPYVIDSEAYTYGDDALAAILEGRQILIKVPNSYGSNLLYSSFMPVLQYQLPNQNNNYLTLFYLRDGIAENIMTAMQTGSFDGVYGVIEMMLSTTYTECPLKVNPIK